MRIMIVASLILVSGSEDDWFAQLLDRGSSSVLVVQTLSAEQRRRGSDDRGPGITWVTVSVERTLRGSALPETLTLELQPSPDRPFAGGPVRTGLTYIAFLRRESEEWRLTHPDYGLMRISQSTSATAPDSLRLAVLLMLRQSLDDQDAEVAQAALRALAEMRDLDSVEQAVDLSGSENPHVAALALELLFSTVGVDPESLRSAVRLIETESRLTERQRGRLAWSIARADPAASVSDLVDLMNSSKNGFLKAAAAWSLGEHADHTAVPSLIRCLESAQGDMQYDCVKGLYRVTGRKRPSIIKFMDQKDRIKREWMTWWEQNQSDYVD